MNTETKYVDKPEDEYVTLQLDGGIDVDCDILAIFPAENKQYIALLPSTGPDAGTGKVYLYGYSENESGEPLLSNIESCEELKIASEAYNNLIEYDEYNEILDESDLNE
ncbi:MAG: DUF1292 domain-containing protein [Lachnospiraceae bacterium]|nr:DUF1292 domain-containing protein [Lachnospiraceae bacterium]MDE6233719.1 DUF1292 domain-containing protein [Lachnospiraceae bacterium]MDE6254284.1 DUF1292 domain-containing protein [Lachnospiraceae bacterium]